MDEIETLAEYVDRLERENEELKFYKRALELLSEELDDRGLCVDCDCTRNGKTPCSYAIVDTFVKRARDEE